jgi:hypothetical protein
VVLLATVCLGLRAVVAHEDDDDHAHAGDACTLTHGSATYDLAPLKSTSRTYAYTDQGESTSYYFSICNRADDVPSTECVDAANNYTKMPVFACQIAYQRAGLISLGVDQVLTPYEAGPGIPAFAGASGVRIRMTGGTQCHHNPNELPDGNPYREMDVWLKCNPDATGDTIVAPPTGIEETYCEYDVLFESSHGCRLCTDSDYVGSVVDPAPIDGQDGCRDDGNWTIRYEKKPGVQCSHGMHGGATTSADLNEVCSSCPAGFKRVNIEGTAFYECQACPAGSTSNGRNAPHCTSCKDQPGGNNKFTDQAGMNQCFSCGVGTHANSEHTGCEFSSGHNCEYNAGGTTWDLSNMANLQNMYGPVKESYFGHEYYLNLCTKSHVDHACYTKNDDPVISYSCQILQGGGDSKDLGDVIGFSEFDTQQRAMYPDGGVVVQLTRGDVCHHSGANPRRETKIIVACDASAGVGNPETPSSSEWNPGGDVEISGACAYEFLWKSRYGCPKCSIDTGTGGTYRKVSDECDPDTGFTKITYSRVESCIGHPVTGDQLDSYTGPETFVDTGTELCIPSCPAGTHMVQQTVTGGTKNTCEKCPKGQYGPGGSGGCNYCEGNTYTYDAGFAECVECGAGSSANQAHTECDMHDCRFNVGSSQYDLKALDKGQAVSGDMYGPIRDTSQHDFWINMCSRKTASDRNCLDTSHNPIESFVCQRTTLSIDSTSETMGHLIGKNLGDTMGVDYAFDGGLGLTVNFTHGLKCHQHGAPNRVTSVDMVCDESAGIGFPEPYQGTVESGYCSYRFTWKSVHACPVCSSEHYTEVTSECAPDTNGANSRTTTFVKNSTCNTASAISFKPKADVIEPCTLNKEGGGGDSNTEWYQKPSFFITIIVLTTTLFGVVVTFALVKYWKVRRLYETYAQLDKDRGMSDDFTLPESMELSSRADGGL